MDEEEQVEYALKITIFETLKIIGVILIYSLLGYSFEAMVATFSMIVVRPFIGGYHEDTQIKCFAATLIIIGSVLYLSTNLNIDIISKLILDIISLYCIWNQVPVVNPKMTLSRPELIKRNRKIGISISIIFVIMSILFNRYIIFSNIITWTLIFQSLLLFNKRSS